MANGRLRALQLNILQDFDYEAVDRMRSALSGFAWREHEDITERQSNLNRDDLSNEEEYMETSWLQDEDAFVDEIVELGDELAIVGIYKLLEIHTKRVVRAAFPDIDGRSLFRFDTLIEAFRDKGVDLTSVTNFSEVDELRCLNNAIKHTGTVSSELASYPDWTQGETLSDLGKVYERLAPQVQDYVRDLTDKSKVSAGL